VDIVTKIKASRKLFKKLKQLCMKGLLAWLSQGTDAEILSSGGNIYINLSY
jgi:hypothetical protein